MMREQGSDTQQAGKHTAFLRGMDGHKKQIFVYDDGATSLHRSETKGEDT